MSLQYRHRGGNQNVYCTLEHLKRRSDGGTLYFTNVVAAHGKCNSGRHGKIKGYKEHFEKMKAKFEMLCHELEFHHARP